MADNQHRKSFWTFWTTLPGILSGLAALITAVGGLITAIYVVTASGSPDPPPTSTVGAVVNPTPTQARDTAILGLPATGAPAATPLAPRTPTGGETPLAPGVTEMLLSPGEKVVHRLDIPPQGRAEVSLQASGVCFQAAVLDSAGARVSGPSQECGVSEYFAILTDGSPGGPYYLEVTGGSSRSAGSYIIDFQLERQDDAGSGGDAGDSLRSAALLEGRLSKQGVVGSHDPEDYYRFNADASTSLEVQYGSWEELDVHLLTLGPSAEVVKEEAVLRGRAVDFSQRQEQDFALRIAGHGGEVVYTVILGMKTQQ